MTAQNSTSNMLNRFGSAFQDISSGKVNPGQVWFLDMFAFGLGGLISLLTPSIITTLFGGGMMSIDKYALLYVRINGVYMLGLGLVAYAASRHPTKILNQTFSFFWLFNAFVTFLHVSFSIMGYTGFVLMFLHVTFAVLHLRETGLIRF